MTWKPRDQRNGQWLPYAQSQADVVLTAERALFELERLTPKRRDELASHLDDVDAATGVTNADRYLAFAPVTVSEDLVWVRRGAPRELQWRLHNAAGEALQVPKLVAGAVNVPDTTDQLARPTHLRDAAHRTWQKHVDARARRRGRQDPDVRYKTVAAENAAYGAYLEAEASFIAAKASAAEEAYAELVNAAEPFTNAFIREQDRLFDADAAGAELEPLSVRTEQARQAAFRHGQASRAAARNLRAWSSDEYVKRRASGQVVQLPAAHTDVYEHDQHHPLER
ncbi:hypothetical protein ACFVAJ_16645 [Agromyces sp. NPDC057679]|uniref:hypothetical protein n=1 Tax=Agromyces sp. NPDC057679 TaxID=3346207 RepID=UPI00366DB1A6